MNFNVDVFWTALSSWAFFKGALITLALAVVSHATAIAVSVPMAVVIRGRPSLLRGSITAYIGFFRAAPTLLLLLFVWNALPQFIPIFRQAWFTPFLAAWIALGAPANAVLRIDARTGGARRIPVGRFSVGVAVGFGSVWVAEREDDTVRRIDPLTGRTRRVIAVGHVPAEVAVGQGSVWVASECAGTVSRIDPATDRVVRTIKLGHHPFNLAVGGGFGWVGVRKNVYFGTCS